MAGWLLPALGYVVTVGIAGITTKVALRTIDGSRSSTGCRRLRCCADPLALVYHKPMALGSRRRLGRADRVCAAAGGLIFLFYALSKGDASVVVPTTSAYPVIALIGVRSSSPRASPCRS